MENDLNKVDSQDEGDQLLESYVVVSVFEEVEVSNQDVL